MRHYELRRMINTLIFKLRNSHKEKFECPICSYCGLFLDIAPSSGFRKHARCPNCTALEWHRLQFLVLQEVLRDKKVTHWKMLHIAPEPFSHELFLKRVGQYETADFKMKGGDHIVDLQSLPFGGNTYDFVYASHVLEHVPDDQKSNF